jgi:dTDP-4-dehydrorhamnose 3,5-epimerase
MDAVTTPFSGLLVLKLRRIEDRRGFFCESYNKQRLVGVGIDADFVQDNLSLSKPAGTLRGLHFQREPKAQAKLVGVLKGVVRDVVVDLRRSSKTYGQPFSILLSEAEGNQLFVPVGFAHGFVTLEPNTLFVYKVSNYYSAEHDTGIRFDDPVLGIEWGRAADALVVSERDQMLPGFDPRAEYFP